MAYLGRRDHQTLSPLAVQLLFTKGRRRKDNVIWGFLYVLRDCRFFFLPLTTGAGTGSARTVAAGVAAASTRRNNKNGED